MPGWHGVVSSSLREIPGRGAILMRPVGRLLGRALTSPRMSATANMNLLAIRGTLGALLLLPR